ncbi:hypothetical protein ACFV9C_28780 [Kribbella sp. NPDC059898]|uniref:hypothetical protein n=1 Tax=Kribbella sp. NPDC059898 TaxID=3346995 RepID=UPI00365425BD
MRRQILRRLSWGVADQAVSSLENFLLGVYVARTLGAASLGALGVAFVAYGIILNVSRALSTDALMVRFSDVPRRTWRQGVAASSGVALLVGLAGGVGCVAIGVVLRSAMPGSEVGGAFIALAAGLPGLTLQDSWRQAFFAAGEGAKAFVNDSVWTVLLLGALLVGGHAGAHGVAWSLLAFGGSATLSALFGVFQAGIVPRPRAATGWLRRHRDLGPRFLVENVVLASVGQVRAVVVAATVGLAAVGAIRGGEMLVGPVSALLMGLAQVAVPEAARAVRRSDRHLRRFCLGLSGGLAVVSFAWSLVVLVVFPFGLGRVLLGTVWPQAQVLVLGITVRNLAGCLQVGPSAGLRALGRADRTMRCQLANAPLAVVFCAAGALAWGAQGAVWGSALAAILGTGIWWQQLTSALRQHVPEGSPA